MRLLRQENVCENCMFERVKTEKQTVDFDRTKVGLFHTPPYIPFNILYIQSLDVQG